MSFLNILDEKDLSPRSANDITNKRIKLSLIRQRERYNINKRDDYYAFESSDIYWNYENY